MASTAWNLIRKFNKMKTLPHVVTKLSKLIHDDNATMKDFEEVIKMDPTLVVRLLNLVNSPYYGLVQKADSISRAVAFLGTKNLYTLAVTDALKNIFSSSTTASEMYSRQQLWLHCAAVSICSKLLAERLFGICGDDAYLCGILHDFGLIVEEQVAEAAFLDACNGYSTSTTITAIEHQYLDTNHCEIGYLLMQEWSIPPDIQEAIRDHHSQLDDVVPESLTGILQISVYITEQLGYTALRDNTAVLSTGLATHIEDNMEEYQVLIDDLPEAMENAKDLYDSAAA